MKSVKVFLMFSMVLIMSLFVFGCKPSPPTADEVQQAKQEQASSEGNRQVGMPSIVNFNERKILKQIYELRDQENLSTYCYHISEQTGKMTFLGNSIGFPVSAATQYTNPQKIVENSWNGHYTTVAIPQSDPNLNFSPQAAEGSWVMMIDPATGKPHPCYFETRVNCFPFKMH